MYRTKETPVGQQRPLDKALFAAIRADDVAAARRALDSGASPGAREIRLTHPSLKRRDPGGKRYLGTTALLEAMKYGRRHFVRLQLVRLLIDRGADVNASGLSGETPLMVLPTDGNIPVLRLLIAHGAKANKTNHRGETAFLLAGRDESIEAMKLLLNAGADINAGRPTPLMEALYSPFGLRVEFLLKHGADPNIRWAGQTALDIAEVNSEEWKLLIKAGGKGLSAAQRKKQVRPDAQDEQREEELRATLNSKREKAFIASLPQRDTRWVPEDREVFNTFFLDFVENSHRVGLGPIDKTGPILIKENSLEQYLTPHGEFGGTDEQEVEVSLELRASLVVRNQTARKLTSLKLPHRDLQLERPRTGFLAVFGKEVKPRLWLMLSLPGYSRDYQTAVVDFQFYGSSTLVKRGTWFLKKQAGKWIVQWRAIHRYA